jgi:hypothetical protein
MSALPYMVFVHQFIKDEYKDKDANQILKEIATQAEFFSAGSLYRAGEFHEVERVLRKLVSSISGT